MAQLTLVRARKTQSAHTAKSGFRPDVQGLRAIAVGLVLFYHAGAPFLPGGFVGVDVFFVISGFLITGILLKEAQGSRSISLAGFYARRAKRILPAATVVLLAVSGATILMLPRTRWDDIAGQILGSAFNVVNWVFAGSAIDYLNSDDAASPVQHFWTLSVEEQFYLLWPILLAAALYFGHGRSAATGSRNKILANWPRFRRFTIIGVLAITLPSLVFSIYFTGVNPGAAYFVTTTRLWELGIGSVVAVFAPELRNMNAKAASVVGWVGLGAIVISGLFYSSATPFPGMAACLPTLGAAGVIIAGMAGRDRRGVGRILSVAPARWVGDISYSLYLWHWPMIVIGTYLMGELGFQQGLIIVSVAIIPAYLSYRFVEVPLKDLKVTSGVALQSGAIAIMVTAIFAVGILLIPKPSPEAGYVPPVVMPGATATAASLTGAELLATEPATGQPKDSVGHFMPSALTASADNPAVYKDGCHQSVTQAQPTACTYGEPGAAFRVAVVGDSHAAQWVPALTRLAKENGWRVDSYTKSSCPFVGTPILAEGKQRVYDECTAWNNSVTTALTGSDRPNLVLVTGQSYSTTGEASFAEGLASAWSKLRDADVPFAVLIDTPRPGIDIPECVITNSGTLTKCAVSKDKALANGSADQRVAARSLTGVHEVDMNEFICPAKECAPIIGNVLVYRDSNHLTATYSATLAPALGSRLSEILPPEAVK